MIRNTALLLAILILIGTALVSPDWPTVSAQPSTTVTLAASGDTYLKGGTPNTNEGASTFVRVRQSGPNRALIRFSQSEIQAAVDGGILVSAKVRMTIIDNENNWGTTGRTVDAHRVLVDWTEGNGLNGEGATWNCPKDTNIANQVPDGPLWKDLGPPYKDGGSYVATPTSTITITNGMSGVVEWTVTADVAAFLAGTSNYGWIIRKTDEGSSGRVDFASKENSVTNNRPQLVITYTSPPISKIVFTTSPQTLTAGVPSAVMTIQTQDANGNPANVASDTTIALSSTSHSGKFSLSTSPWSDAVSLTISAGSNSVSFYYKDTIAGTPTITAAKNPSEGWIDATQQETVNPAALEHFDFSPISSPQTSGVAFTITITSKDVYGNTVTSYTGSNTLSDSTGTIDPTATDVFSSGVWTGSATITKAQAGVIITTTGNGKSGTSNSFNVNPAGSNKLVITVDPPSVTVGSWTSKYIVQRQDQYGNPATSGLITVNLESSSTGNAKSFALTPDGATVTSVTIQDGFSTSEFYYYDEKSGTWMISVSATGVTGDSEPLTVNVASLDHIVASPDPKTVTAGESVTYTAVAYDVYGNSRGDVSTSTSWSISSGAGGSWSVNVYTSEKAGTWTVTGTCDSKSDTATLTVSPASLDHFTFNTIDSPQTAGTAFSITITAKDRYENTVTSYTGSNTLSDSTGTISPASTGAFSAGVWTGSVTVTKAQKGVTITTTGSTRTGASNSFDLNPASGNKLVITGYSSYVTAGSWTTVYTVQRQDQYGNPVTSGSTTVNLASTSTGAAKKFAETLGGLPVTSVTIPDGSSAEGFYYYDESTGTWTISVSAAGLTGDSKPLTVNPSALASFTMNGYPSSTTAGQNFGSNDVTVTAYDAYGNVKTDYTGQVYFTSTDPQAVLPCTSGSKYTFTTGAGGDNGVHAFAGTGFTLNTLGSQTTSVTDGTVSLTSFPITVSPAAVSITITSDPTGSGFVKVDGSSIITPQTFMWVIGPTHDLEALSPVSGGSGIQYVWTSWSDGGGQSHTYTTPLSPQTVTANYGTHEEIVTSTGSGTAYFDTNTGVLSDLSAVNEASLPAAGRPNLIFPHGFFSFTITDLTPGGTASVTITLPSAVPVGTQYWKYGPTPTDPTNHWYQLPMGDDDGDNMITITLVDGGLGDDDLTLDGVIIDQGGPANPPAPVGAPVGGYVAPVNRLAILAPFLVLFGVTAAVIVLASVPRRHVH